MAQALVPVLVPLDFPCVVLEDRAEFADPVLFPGARAVRLVVRGRIAAAPYYHDAEALVRRRVEEFVAELNRTFGAVLSYGELYCAVDLLECVSRIDALSVEPIGDFLSRTRTDDIVVPPNSIYEIERFELSFTGSL